MLATALVSMLVAAPRAAHAASTEPRFAIVEASAFRATSSQRISLRVGTSFSFADTLQLSLPLQVLVQQGALAARLDLAGNVFTSTSGGAEQPAPGPGILSVGEREILLVLPTGFVPGPATVQLSTDVGGQVLTSNSLTVTL
jgi:hypothetical protein